MLRMSPAGAQGAWRSVYELRYSRWTSRSPVKVEEQLVMSAQGTPAAITALLSRFRLEAASALGHTTVAGARGGHARNGAFSEWRGCPDSSLTPSSAPAVGQTGSRLVLPWGRAPSAENIQACRPGLSGEAAVLGPGYGSGD